MADHFRATAFPLGPCRVSRHGLGRQPAPEIFYCQRGVAYQGCRRLRRRRARRSAAGFLSDGSRAGTRPDASSNSLIKISMEIEQETSEQKFGPNRQPGRWRPPSQRGDTACCAVRRSRGGPL
jgi:hypothetical protein